jgi:murein DD-endopeptidase MepM/ murein hydrolase activator NlpD
MPHRLSVVLLFVAVFSGCQATVPATVTFPSPVRWQSPTASPTRFFPTRERSLTPTLAPTPTPRTYTVRAGDTFGSIATKFGVTVDDLIRANPGVDPNALPIGTVLVIPVRPSGSETPQPSPTPVGLDVGSPCCYLQPDGGKWCVVLVGNPGPDAAAGIYLRFSLYPAVTDEPSAVREEALPVTVLPAGRRAAAAAFFPPEESQDDILRVELLGAVRAEENPGLLPLTLVKEESRSIPEGMELTVAFRIDTAEETAANRLDAVLALVDGSGRPVGFRILHETGDWPSGTVHELTLTAFVLGGKMEDYDFLLQARAA